MTLPRIGHALVDAQGRVTPEYYRWMLRVDGAAGDTDLSALATLMGSPDGTVANIPNPPFVRIGTNVTAGEGIEVDGSLALGGVQVALAELADAGTGTAIWKFTRDDYGRVSGTQAADTDDLAEGETNLYFTNERAQDAVAAAIAAGTHSGISFTYDDANNKISATVSGSGGVDVTTLPFVANPLMMRGCWGMYAIPPNSGSPTIFNVNTSAVAQTIASSGIQNVSVTSAFNRQTRFRYTSAATAGSMAATWSSIAVFCMDGGMFLGLRLGNADAATVAQARCFFGVRASFVAPANSDPSTWTDMFGFGADSGDTNLQFMHNDGSGTATKIDLGANFPANTSLTDWYEIQLLSVPASGIVQYHIRNVNNGMTASGSVSTNLPSGPTGLGWIHWRNNGTTALAVTYHFGGFALAYSLE